MARGRRIGRKGVELWGTTHVRRLLRSPVTGTVAGVLSVAVSITAFLRDPTAGALLLGFFVLAGTLIALVGLRRRDEYGGAYEALSEIHEWIIDDVKGVQAQLIKHRTLRIMQPAVFTLVDYAWGDGDQEEVLCSPFEIVHQFLGADGRYISIIALGEPRQPDDIVEYTFRRVLKGTFVDTTNWCQSELIHDTRELTLRIVFPVGKEPLEAYFWRQTSRYKRQELRVSHGYGGRAAISKTLRWPEKNELYTISWTWEPG